MANPLKHIHLFEDVVQKAQSQHIGVNDPTYVRLDIPSMLLDAVVAIIEATGYTVDDTDCAMDDEVFLALQTDSNCRDLQDALMELGIPYKISVENSHDETESRVYRWINGQYMSLHSTEMTETISAYHVMKLLEQQAYTALQIHARNRLLSVGSWDYTPDDIQKTKQAALRWTVSK